MTTDLRYPIGKAETPPDLDPEQRRELISRIERTPDRLREAVAGLNAEQLDTPYRPGGWSVRQLVHHVPDSHLNAYTRFKLALTEDEPTIKTYDEGRWAELPDSRSVPVEVSLALLDNLHRRWVALLRALPEADFRKTLRHPEWGRMTLDQVLGLYAWHGDHHVAHVTSLRQRMGWL
jgi:uncharacterized damage-inducible protein DinB